jgi:hypothetical protein
LRGGKGLRVPALRQAVRVKPWDRLVCCVCRRRRAAPEGVRRNVCNWLLCSVCSRSYNRTLRHTREHGWVIQWAAERAWKEARRLAHNPYERPKLPHSCEHNTRSYHKDGGQMVCTDCNKPVVLHPTGFYYVNDQGPPADAS